MHMFCVVLLKPAFFFLSYFSSSYFYHFCVWVLLKNGSTNGGQIHFKFVVTDMYKKAH